MPGGHVADPVPSTLQQTGSPDAEKGREDEGGGAAHTAYGPAAKHMGLLLEEGPAYAPRAGSALPAPSLPTLLAGS